jgi:hypothetical protein
VSAATTADEIISTIKELKDASRALGPSDEIEDFRRLLEAAQTKNHVVIFTSSPAETRAGAQKANDLSEKLIYRAIDPVQSEQNQKIFYEFYVIGHSVAVRARNAIIKQTAIQLNCSDDDAIGYVEHAERSGRLAIFSISVEFYIPPICLFEPDSPNTTEGFMLFYLPDDKVSVAYLDSETIADVYGKLLLPVRDEGAKFNKRRLSKEPEGKPEGKHLAQTA